MQNGRWSGPGSGSIEKRVAGRGQVVRQGVWSHKRNLHKCCVIVIKVYTGSQACARNILEEIAKNSLTGSEVRAIEIEFLSKISFPGTEVRSLSD